MLGRGCLQVNDELLAEGINEVLIKPAAYATILSQMWLFNNMLAHC
jgi:hypothetical protein